MAEATLSLLQELFPTLDSALLTDIVAGAGAECSVESLVEELLSMQQQQQHQQQHQRVQEETPLPATDLCSATRPPNVDGKPATSLHSGGSSSSSAPVRSAHTTNEGEESGALVLVPPISSDDHLPMPCSSSSSGASPWGGPPRQERAAAASLEDQLASIRQHRKERWRKESSSSSSSNNKRQPAREDTVGQAQSTSGFDIGLWRQMKDFRTKQRAKWSRSSERKKAMTLSDLAEPNSDTTTAAAATAAGGASRMPHIEKIGHECLTLTNNFRQRSGLRPLRWETVLYKIGLQHSHSMGTGQVEFGHAGFKERMQAVPYRPRHMAENVAYSQGVADVAGTAVHGWIRSPGHRKNILCPAANRCAIAVYCNSRGRYYLTQLFSD